ncbi:MULTISPECIES: helix-turn-helix domain-containing protein [unclassified Brachybacterium]|uniref:helix-turn-helix domain-containing protein n=1 Tax=unclassified Brachybacterium TaxID=2623841 RepID=UPI003F91D5AF
MNSRRIRTPQDLGAALRDGRKARALTQAELAQVAGVSREWLIGVEQGNRPRAELEKVLAVLTALDLPLTVGAASRTVTPDAPEHTTSITERATREAIEAMREASAIPVVVEHGQRAARLLNAGVDPELAAHLAQISRAATPTSDSSAAGRTADEDEDS